MISVAFNHVFYCIGLLLGNSPFKLRHTRPVAYSVEHVLLNKHLISGGGAYLLPRDHLLLKVQKTSIVRCIPAPFLMFSIVCFIV